ncbi:hypothetical protein [Brevibacterium jeotgali]|uniref:Uncharacterized protein n=1 Tax=Brevibacterium jeotgali TaxID=1262550 RepID=A0A2H1L3W6_9MICO|nr:hypothetical protein [Brevibacterium jeotgali]TWC01839.1 hypothetical protein FB108_0495 [Brevibacterium jeotgali]SMY11586.1 hypothetical protein BJEO58_01171 [Brevibacterium jeotgali]
MTALRTLRGRAAAALATSALVALTACSQDTGSEAGATTPTPDASPTAPQATEETAGDGAEGDDFASAVTRDLDIEFGSAPYDRIPACHHDGPVTVDGGRATFAPSNPSQELTDMGAEVELTLTGGAGYVEIGPGGRSYAAVPFSCSAVGGDAPDGAEAQIDSGELFVGGTQDGLQVMGLVTAGDPITDEGAGDEAGDDPGSDDPGSDEAGTEEAGTGEPGSATGDGEEASASAVDILAHEPSGMGMAQLHSSLRNGDGYRFYIREEREGDTDEPSGRGWKNVAWDGDSGSVRQFDHVEDFMDSVPRPDETLVVGVDGDNGILPGQEDLSDQEAFEAITASMGEPDAESSEFAEEGAHRGYRSESRTWGTFQVTYYSPADGEPDWVGTCLAWKAELGELPDDLTLAAPMRMGMSLSEYPYFGSTEADHVEDGEAPSLVTTDDGRYTVDVMGGTRMDGMLTTVASGTGCARV